jgi:hypothetical protein
MPEEQTAEYELPFGYVKEHVYPVRVTNRRSNYANKWWQYGGARPGMRKALEAKERSIGTARVAKHRVFVWLEKGVLPNDQVVIFARDDDYFLGVLHARPHRTWSMAQGTQLRERESGFRYTPSISFETYPMPWVPGSEPTTDPRYLKIVEAARDLVEKRDAWLKGSTPSDKKPHTLTRLYNENPTWLQMAHKRIDEAVFEGYGWDLAMTDEQLLDELLKLNLSRAETPAPPPT